jgi:hypothetical protein
VLILSAFGLYLRLPLLRYQPQLIRNVSNTQQREAGVQSQPEHHVPHKLVALEHWRPAYQDQWDLDELHQEQVHAALFHDS